MMLDNEYYVNEERLRSGDMRAAMRLRKELALLTERLCDDLGISKMPPDLGGPGGWPQWANRQCKPPCLCASRRKQGDRQSETSLASVATRRIRRVGVRRINGSCPRYAQPCRGGVTN
jgi:hypothetical protein